MTAEFLQVFRVGQGEGGGGLNDAWSLIAVTDANLCPLERNALTCAGES